MRSKDRKRRAGQIMMFFIMVLVILVFMVLWNFDVHKILYVKSLSQNAGDSAALMAARWQGITLNIIGDLNILHALALSSGDGQEASAITNIQARLCYVGPMIALLASQQAAKNNGIYAHSEFTEYMREHADKVRNDYPEVTGDDGEPLFPEPYPGCWEEYADMLDMVANEGVAAGPDNFRTYGDYVGGHYLLMVDFYEAISGRSWCWFHHNAPELLGDYENFFPCWWDDLPDIPRAEYINCEVFGLGLVKAMTALSTITDTNTMSAFAEARELPGTISSDAMAPVAAWYCYGSSAWSTWDAMATEGVDYPFPATGPIKPQYDYVGADAAIRVEAETERLTPGPAGAVVKNTITWTAAAKPFGYLDDEETSEQVVPSSCGIVLPAFHDVRLIPVDACTAPSGGGYNLDWRRHIEDHLPEYMEDGPGQSSCWYCQQLVTWESDSFRQDGVDWLGLHSDRCTVVGGDGGGRRGGGRRRGH